jgi:hypothetical protein
MRISYLAQELISVDRLSPQAWYAGCLPKVDNHLGQLSFLSTFSLSLHFAMVPFG